MLPAFVRYNSRKSCQCEAIKVNSVHLNISWRWGEKRKRKGKENRIVRKKRNKIERRKTLEKPNVTPVAFNLSFDSNAERKDVINKNEGKKKKKKAN